MLAGTSVNYKLGIIGIGGETSSANVFLQITYKVQTPLVGAEGTLCWNYDRCGQFKNMCSQQETTTNDKNFLAILLAHSTRNPDDWYIDQAP